MNVHIVVKSIWDDWVISRLTKYLVDGLGWSYGKKPRKKADVNIFFPYLEWRHSGWTQTKTAAWFTHERQTEWGHKVWKRTAQAIDLCVTPAAMYVDSLAPYGQAIQIPHPVDLDHFTIEGPQAFRSRGPLTIGISGIVNKNDRRKGEALVEDLVHGGIDVYASGSGWPCPTHWYSWDEMPMFYRSIDLYLVTAKIEGGPVTVLEAMACGKPVAVPEGVGQCDEYPLAIRYPHGPSWKSHVLEGYRELDIMNLFPSDWRAVAEQYPVSRWCEEWKTAIEEAFG